MMNRLHSTPMQLAAFKAANYYYQHGCIYSHAYVKGGYTANYNTID